MGSGINNKINEILCNPKNVKKRRNTRLEKCCGHVNIATAYNLLDLYQMKQIRTTKYITYEPNFNSIEEQLFPCKTELYTVA